MSSFGEKEMFEFGQQVICNQDFQHAGRKFSSGQSFHVVWHERMENVLIMTSIPREIPRDTNHATALYHKDHPNPHDGWWVPSKFLVSAKPLFKWSRA